MNLRKWFVLCAAMLFAIVTLAQEQQTIHVKSIRAMTKQEEPDPKSMFTHLVLVGTIGDKTYTLTALNAGWNTLEPGKDYPATVKLSQGNPSKVSIESVWKNKPSRNDWSIRGIEAN